MSRDTPMEMVKQTGNTVILEEFNSDENVTNLVTLLTKDSEERTAAEFLTMLKDKDDGLVVNSYEDFLDRFAPMVYETCVSSEGELPKFVYTLEKPPYDCPGIKLNLHPFYKMIVNLMNRKASIDKVNLEFIYDDIKKVLSPLEEMESFKDIRRNLLANMKEVQKLMDSGKPSSDAVRLKKNFDYLRDQISQKYESGSPVALLGILIADRQLQIDAMKEVQNSIGTSDGNVPKIEYVRPVITDQMTIGYEKIETSSSKEAEDSNALLLQYREAIEDDFNEQAPAEIRENKAFCNLMVSSLLPQTRKNALVEITPENLNKLEMEKKQLQDIYCSTLTSFAKAVSHLVEKFIGVRAFFDHASVNGKLADDTYVIISNCKADKILKNEIAKKRFAKYFNHLGVVEKAENRTWFAIIPGVQFNEKDYSVYEESDDSDVSIGDMFPSRSGSGFFSRKKDKKSEEHQSPLVTLSSAKEMMNILADAKIMTFINDKACNNTGFATMKSEKIKTYKNELKSVNSEYGVFSYPNFTILPKERTDIKIGNEQNSEGVLKDKYIQVPGVYLDSAYVSCGMVVGVQNLELLKGKGLKVSRSFPGVRFDFEEGEHNKIVTTNLNRETATETQQDVRNEILVDRFGFAFADNRIMHKGNLVKSCYVINSRTLAKRPGSDKYKPIYTTLVKNVVDQILRTLSDPVSDNTIKEFKKDYVNDWKDANKDPDKKYDNRILMDDETIEQGENKNSIVIRFNHETEAWNVLDINDESNAKVKENK